ncbi:MAG: PAS domain S-box protein [Snowella sp.]|nr:PAS domain S-box protein [Snowella sp.]
MLDLVTNQPINLDKAIAREPLLTVSPDISLPEVIELFHGARGKACDLVSTPKELQIIPSCVFVVNQEKLIGIITERDLVKLVAQGATITDTSTVAEIMSHPVIALPYEDLKDVFEVLSLFRVHGFRHLPILNKEGSPIGCITHSTLRQVLRSVDLLRLRAVKEVMHSNVIHAPPTTPILGIAQLMAHHRVSCIVIAEALSLQAPSAKVHYNPLGIITERDIIQFQALGLDVRQITAEEVMSCPLTLISSNEALDNAYGIMKEKRIQRLVVTGEQGELAGIITQSSVLQILNPSDMYGLINVLQDKVTQLETEKINLLESRNHELEKLVEERTTKLKTQAQTEQLKSELTLKIRDSNQLSTILENTVAEIRDFMLVDRVLIYRFNGDLSGTVVAESVGERWTASIDQTIKDTCLQGGLNVRYHRGWYWKVEDIDQARLTDCHRELLSQFEVKAALVIPIIVSEIESVSSLLVVDDPVLANLPSSQGQVWGLLILHQCNKSREWPTETIALLETLVDQLAIAIRQSLALEMANQEIANRQLIDQKLQEVSSKWTSFVENSPNTVYTLNREGIVLSVNHCCQGETFESVIGTSFYDLTPSYLRKKRKEQIENVLEMGIVITDDGERPNPDGSLNYYQVQIIPVWQFRKITKILVVLIDVTERRKVEVQLHQLNEELENRVEQRTAEVIERETQLRDFFDNATDLIQSITPEGKFLFVNRAWKDTLGYSDQDLMNLTIRDVIHPRSLNHCMEMMQSILIGQEAESIEATFVTKDGREIIVEGNVNCRVENGRAIATRGIFRDISDRKKTETTLKRQIAAIEATSEGIGIVNENDEYIYLNKAHYEMFGYDKAEDLLGKTWREIYYPDEIQRIEQEVFPLLSQNGHWKGEVVAKRRDGSTFAEDIALTLIDGVGLICVARDISDRKESEKQLQNSYEQLAITNAELARATRLKDEFLANMSHELRTPLNSILGFSESLQEGVFGEISEKQRKPLRTIEASGEHLLSLINDILDLSKIEAGKLDMTQNSISLVSLCESSLNFIRQQAFKKRISVHFSPPTQINDFVADERRLRQILINLLNNAVKFTPNGGEVRLEVSLDLSVEQPMLNFMIKDTGIGIAKEDLPKLFQSFMQIDSRLARRYEGTGLGLALVERLAKLHGGRVSVESKVGEGSCFSVHLPYHPVSAIAANPTISSTTEPEINQSSFIKSALILLVEDNPNNAQTISTYLEHKGYSLMSANNGEEAIKVINQRKPDLILMDVQMPIMDGLEATRQIRKNPEFAEIPIIALTALAMPGDRDRCFAAGMNDYLSKPIRMRQLTTMIEQNLLKEN